MADYLAWLRARVGHALLPLAYATAIVQDDQGRVLFQRRADFGQAWWGLPGGLLDPGETPAACARREVLEETGLQVEPLRLTGVYSSPRYLVTYPNGDQVQQVTLCYACRLQGGVLRPQASEILQLEFFEPAALPPRPRWYADMLDHYFQRDPLSGPYFDPPEHMRLDTPYSTLLDLRSVVGHAPLIWPGTSAAVLDAAGRVLLQHRSDFDAWSLPGGALDTGESLAQTVIRETREETGLAVVPERLLSVHAGHDWTFPNKDVLYPVGALFACRIIGGELRADGHETRAVRFFARDALPPLHPVVQDRVDTAFATGALT
jgi:ADP-ribose pyrophosphatase YjhB (NUDIX family)